MSAKIMYREIASRGMCIKIKVISVFEQVIQPFCFNIARNCLIYALSDQKPQSVVPAHNVNASTEPILITHFSVHKIRVVIQPSLHNLLEELVKISFSHPHRKVQNEDVFVVRTRCQ